MCVYIYIYIYTYHYALPTLSSQALFAAFGAAQAAKDEHPIEKATRAILK